MKKFLLIALLGVFFISCSNDDKPIPDEDMMEEEEMTDPETSTLSVDALVHYTFDGNVEDSTDNEYDGTNNGATFISDRYGIMNAAILFDGDDDYVDLPNLSELKPMAPISFSFWVRYDSEDNNSRSLFNTSYEEGVNSGIYFNAQNSTGNYAVNFGDGSNSYTSATRRTYVGDTSIETGVWNHVVVMVNSALDMDIYVNTVKTKGTFSGTGGDLQYSNTAGSLGRHYRSNSDPINYFEGALDDFRYWNRALTEEEIVELYNVE